MVRHLPRSRIGLPGSKICLIGYGREAGDQLFRGGMDVGLLLLFRPGAVDLGFQVAAPNPPAGFGIVDQDG